jgi:hypothetical protein
MSCTDWPLLMIEAYLVVAVSTLYRLPEVRMRSYTLAWPDGFWKPGRQTPHQAVRPDEGCRVRMPLWLR